MKPFCKIIIDLLVCFIIFKRPVFSVYIATECAIWMMETDCHLHVESVYMYHLSIISPLVPFVSKFKFQ